MSNQANTELEEAARFYMEEWTGTLMEKLLQHDLETLDYESLAAHVAEARKMSFDLEYQPELSPTGFNDVR